MARTPTGESVITRMARLLSAFDDRHRSLPVARLAERAELPVGTAHRIVGQLVAAGLLERDDDGAVHLGIRMWELASLAPACPDLRSAAVPVLAGLAAATGQHAGLMVLDGSDVVLVEHVAAPAAYEGLGLRIGRRIPAHAVAGGLVLLAHHPAAAQAAMARTLQVRYTAATPADPEQLLERLDAARRQDWVVADGLVQPDVLSVAVPVRGPDGTVVAALTVVGPRPAARPMELVSRLRRGAADTTSSLCRPTRPVRLPVRHLGPAAALRRTTGGRATGGPQAVVGGPPGVA